MINIILVGCCGKMGMVISEAAKNFDNLNICAGVDRNTCSSINYPVFNSINECDIKPDVILDFSRPDTLDDLISYGKSNNIPIVLCTTGYSDDQLQKISDTSKEIPMFRSANMSIGINVIANVLKNISKLMYENFDIEIVEKHHNQKVDSPSGTALLLADAIKDSIPDDINYIYGREGISKKKHNEIGIHAVRGGSIVGEHDVIFAGSGETIEIKHTAISREVFAIGALKACIFMNGKPSGMYSMNDVINSK